MLVGGEGASGASLALRTVVRDIREMLRDLPNQQAFDKMRLPDAADRHDPRCANVPAEQRNVA